MTTAQSWDQPLDTAPLALDFDNSFVRELPADPDARQVSRPVLGACYSRVAPVPVSEPRLLAHSPETAALLGLSPRACASPEFARVFAGNALLPGMDPYAACYGGHQFGTWAGQLGDGRATSLGEVLRPSGQRWELQLKGAGRTPYSRGADGRAVLRSSIREFLCSEAMFHLGVPTTRALSVVVSPDRVVRDMLYDGHPREERLAIVCRVAPSFLRFGNFEIFASRNDQVVLERLASYALRTHFADLGAPGPAAYAKLLLVVARRTAVMVAHWMRVGFVHGVMNTDNLSLLGLTIDYGPFGMLDHFDPNFTPNTTDAGGRRYRYSYQPRVARWNLAKLAEAFFPLVQAIEPLEAALTEFEVVFELEQRQSLARKLGLRELASESEQAAEDPQSDAALVDELFRVLELSETDFTLFFRGLAELDVPRALELDEAELLAPLLSAYYAPERLVEEARQRTLRWLRRYSQRVIREGTSELERRGRMNAANPCYVLRNYLAQEAIDAADRDDPSLLLELFDTLRQPYTQQAGRERFAQKRPDWARSRAGCSMLSCSS